MKVPGALRGLGFGEAAIKRVLGAMRGEDGLRDATAERWLREAIVRLTSVQ
jgi:Holliday junction resolvasome RuvABC DNA-binding subunit